MSYFLCPRSFNNGEMKIKIISSQVAEWYYETSKAYAERKAYERGFSIGFEEGFRRAKTSMVKNMIMKFDFSDRNIVDIAEVSMEFVQKIRAELNK